MRADLVLVGFGNVGRRFAGLVSEVRPRLLDEWDLDCRITCIVTRRHGGAFRPSGIDGVRAADILEETESLEGLHDPAAGAAPRTGFDAIRLVADSTAPLRVLVETTTLNVHDGQPAVDHVRAALSAGLNVVTANKGPAAFAYRELHAKAGAAGLSFLFEGAVMDGIPVFNLVRETLPAVNVLGFRGVVNATTNHILTALEDGEEFGPALRRMQAEGIAEADASLDVDGWDAAAKAAALANVLMDAGITPHTVSRAGIGPQSAAQARRARECGRRLRLVAEGRRGAIPAVGPTELPEDDLLAGLRGTANALVLETDLLGRIVVGQLDSGLTQTAYAVLSDLVAIRRAARREAPARRTP